MTHSPDEEPRNSPETVQEHSGTGDNVGGDKVDRRNATVYGNAPNAQGTNIVSGQSVSGNVIKIINYYYHEDTQIKIEEKPDEYIPCPYRGLYHFSPQDGVWKEYVQNRSRCKVLSLTMYIQPKKTLPRRPPFRQCLI